MSLIVSLLMVTAIGFAFWLVQASDANGPTYEIRFEQSVDGLQPGAAVNLLGVAIGRITEIKVQPTNPDFVTVRFALTSDTILHRGVTASIERSLFDGSAALSLSGDNNRNPVLSARAGQPFPIIPAKGGGLLGAGSGPADLIAKVSSNAESVSKKLDPAGLRSIEKRLDELARNSQTWAGKVGQVSGRLPQTDRLDAFAKQFANAGDGAARLRRRIEASRGKSRENIAQSLNSADKSAVSFGQSVSRARPRMRQLEADARQVTETVRSLRGPVGRAGDVAKRIEQGGFGSTKLPDYKPSPAGQPSEIETPAAKIGSKP
ncbi:MlaD family protein [Sphingomonas sp. ZB1N12]|uniref:MlaD family protein n=1 Tax=Sphingomonas TaxID=13687 RepID=UPI001613A523|nr:MlaD family protein [Sphingomonas sp. BK481]MBB3589577.1 ABC-type transporter Mla subunit MlaD [Sphingomonas sp. BK481]